MARGTLKKIVVVLLLARPRQNPVSSRILTPGPERRGSLPSPHIILEYLVELRVREILPIKLDGRRDNPVVINVVHFKISLSDVTIMGPKALEVKW